MRRHHAVLLAILVYVSLDLSLPAMPGAFMIESAESVESARIARGRTRAVQAVTLPVLANDSLALLQPHTDAMRGPAPVSAEPSVRRRAMTNSLPRASLDSASSSEDPH